MGGGHDSNIALTPSDASGVSEQSDQFVDAVLVGRWPLNDRTCLCASAYTQRFLDEDDFDVSTLRGGVGRVGGLGAEWDRDVWVDGRHRRFGGDAFKNSALACNAPERGLGARTRLPHRADPRRQRFRLPRRLREPLRRVAR